MNQHYVPRSYLKNFAEQRGKEFFVNVYDKLENRFFKANTRKICSEVDLYTLEEGNAVHKDLFVVEKIYVKGIEPLYLKSYDLLVNHNVHYINDQQRAEILISIFQFHLRNPKLLNRTILFHRNQILAQCEKAKISMAKGVTYLGEDFSFREYSEDEIVTYFERKITKDFKEKHIGGIGEIGRFHEFAKFEVSVIKDESEFFTSDSPLILEDSLSDDEILFQKSKEFIIALNKKVALRIFHDRRLELNTLNRSFIPNGSVAIMNKSILEQSNRFVIADEKTIKEHQRLYSEVLNDTSTEKKIDIIRQILSIVPRTSEHAESLDSLSYYLKKYEQQGFLSLEDEYEMVKKVKLDAIEFVTRRIQ
jgi:hypothetical protein